MDRKGISVQASRFALLHVDDDSDNEDSLTSSQKKQQGKGNQQIGQAKKKNKKKKGGADAAEVCKHMNLEPVATAILEP